MSAFTAMTQLEKYESELDLEVGTIAGKYYLVKFWAKLVKFLDTEWMTAEQIASFFNLLDIGWTFSLSSEESVELLIRNNFTPQHVCETLKRFYPINDLEQLAEKTEIHPFPGSDEDDDGPEEEKVETVSFGVVIDATLDDHDLSTSDRAALKEAGLSNENLPFLALSDLDALSISNMQKRRLCHDLVHLDRDDVPFLDVWEL